MSRASDRVLGAIGLASAIAVVLEARTFTVGFYTDPLGARGLPMISAALIGIGGALLLARPRATVSWPASRSLIRLAATAAVLLAYAAMLQPIGFVLSTAVAVTLISVTFGGPLERSVLLATAYTVVLYAFFVYALGMRLPIGTVFLRGG